MQYAYLYKLLVCVIIRAEVITISKTSATVKNRYNDRTYDNIRLTVRKDSDLSRDVLDNHVEKTGESLTGFIHRAMRETIQRDNDQDGKPEAQEGSK